MVCVEHDAAALGSPLPSPRVELVVLTVTPSEHHQHAKDGTADIARVNRLLDPLHQFVEASLADNPEFDVGPRPPQRSWCRTPSGRQPSASQPAHANQRAVQATVRSGCDGCGVQMDAASTAAFREDPQIAVGLATKPGGEGSRPLGSGSNTATGARWVGWPKPPRGLRPLSRSRSRRYRFVSWQSLPFQKIG